MCWSGPEAASSHRQRRIEVARILRETDRSRSHDQRSTERELPDVEERDQTAGAAGSVDFTQEGVGAAGLRQCCSQLCPDQPIAKRESRAEYPAEHGLRTAHSSDDERQSDERADAHHLQHVERERAALPQFTRQVGRRCGVVGRHALRIGRHAITTARSTQCSWRAVPRAGHARAHTWADDTLKIHASTARAPSSTSGPAGDHAPCARQPHRSAKHAAPASRRCRCRRTGALLLFTRV